MMQRTFFITGTDTEVGKTTIAVGLLHAVRSTGLSTAAIKPVASGCIHTPLGLRNQDALALHAECSVTLPYEEINPYAFAPTIAPHLAAEEAQVALSVEDLCAAVRRVHAHTADFMLVEGAGGWRVPLNSRQYLSDLAIALGLPVILVVGIRLGCINHALLSAQSIIADGLPLAGWVANCMYPDTERATQVIQTLQQHLTAPCLGVVPYQQEPSASQVAKYLRPVAGALYPESNN